MRAQPEGRFTAEGSFETLLRGFVQELNLAPGLLLSMPQLSDPNFTRAVVLMLDHGEDGSFGLIVNQPTPMSVPEILKNLEVDWCGDPDAVVWSGGPVMPTSGWILHSGTDDLGPASDTLDHALEFSGNLKICDGFYLSTSEENIKILAESAPESMRFLLGYAGWSEGQLAEEMAEGSWLHADINHEILFNSPAEKMWEHCLKNIGIDPEAIVQSRGVH